jgi:sugar/nucleoside kinase (ribokinase family)
VFEQNRDMFYSIMSAPRPGITAVDFSDFAERPDFDFLEHYIQQIDIAFFGLRSEQAGVIDALQSMALEHGLLVIVTLGADGSRAFQSSETHEAAAAPVDSVLDTTGAGDAFAAGFLSCYCQSADVEVALLSGATVAAKVVRRHGAN